MKRRTFLKALLGITVIVPFVNRKRSVEVPLPVVSNSGTYASMKRDNYPTLNSVPHDYQMIMSPAQLKAYQELGYDLR